MREFEDGVLLMIGEGGGKGGREGRDDVLCWGGVSCSANAEDDGKMAAGQSNLAYHSGGTCARSGTS